MTDEAHTQWDAAERSIVEAQAAWQAVLEAVPDDMAHHIARNRIVNTLGALEDAAMYGQRARTLAATAQDS